MYKKVNGEIIVGFYSTGPKIKENDIKIDELVRAYCPAGLRDHRRAARNRPSTTAYVSVEEVESDERPGRVRRTFKHVSSMIGAEAEKSVCFTCC